MSSATPTEPTPERRSTTPILLLISLLLICGSLALMAKEVLDLRREVAGSPPGVRFEAFEDLLETPLEDCTGDTHHLGEGNSPYLLVFLFSPYDCPVCHDELPDLQTLADENPQLEVVSLFSGATTDEACQTQKNFGLSFPVLVDTDERWRQALAAPETPWKVLMERSRDGRPARLLFEDPKSSIAAERAALQYRIRLLTGAPSITSLN